MAIDELVLLSGNDIPFVQAGLVVHVPTIKEIGYLGEDIFFNGYGLINFSKNMLAEEDKINLEDKSNFDILIAILREHKNAVMQKDRNCVEMILALIFPDYKLHFSKDAIELIKEGEEEKHLINNDNFDDFKIIFNSIFAFSKDDLKEYNPSGELAKKLIDKFNKRKQILAQQAPKHKKVNILSRYVSILAVGEKKDMNDLLNYTVYQIFDEWERFRLKENFDTYVKAKMAGAKDLKEVEDWMKDIHSEE